MTVALNKLQGVSSLACSAETCLDLIPLDLSSGIAGLVFRGGGDVGLERVRGKRKSRGEKSGRGLFKRVRCPQDALPSVFARVPRVNSVREEAVPSSSASFAAHGFVYFLGAAVSLRLSLTSTPIFPSLGALALVLEILFPLDLRKPQNSVTVPECPAVLPACSY